MKVRIGMANDKYWVEIKKYFIWWRAPSVRDYIVWKFSAMYPDYTIYSDCFEDAQKLADDYNTRFNKGAAVYTRIK